jgi:sodium-dependent dicarboxylate transporter 2/3/5
MVGSVHFLPAFVKAVQVLVYRFLQAVAMKIHPLYFMIPATLCCSYAFMLPVATPPNAIVLAASNMKTTDMVSYG